MIAEYLVLIGIVAVTVYIGAGIRTLLQWVFGRTLQTGPQFSRMRYVLWQVNYNNIRDLTDTQIRALGGWVIIFPLALFLISVTPFTFSAYVHIIIISILFGGSITITWKDLLAVSNPSKWTSYSGYLGINREPAETKIESVLPSPVERPLTYMSISVLIGLLVVALLETQGNINYIENSANPPYTFAAFTRGMGALGSILLSIFLVILYDKQASISKKQTTIQNEQKDLMQRDREPHLSGPYNFRIWGASPVDDQQESEENDVDQRKPDQGPNPNSLQFYQTNAGDGLAQNFRLKVRLTIEEGPHEGRTARCAVQRMDRKPLHKFGESDMQGGEQDIEFITEELKLKFTDPEYDEYSTSQTEPFGEAVSRLYEEGTRNISLIFTLTWENEVGEEEKDQFDFKTGEISSNMDLADFYIQ